MLDGIGEAAAPHRVHAHELPTVGGDRLGDALDDRPRLVVAAVWIDDDAEVVVSLHARERTGHADSSYGIAPAGTLDAPACFGAARRGREAGNPLRCGPRKTPLPRRAARTR